MALISELEDRINSINPKPTYGQGYVTLFSYGCNVDLRVEQIYKLLAYTVLILDEEKCWTLLGLRAFICYADPSLFWMLLRRPHKHNR